MARLLFTCVAAALVSCTTSFLLPVPSSSHRAATSLSAASNDDHSPIAAALHKLSFVPAVLVGVSGMGAVVSPQPALADGAVSSATVTRAGALYGPRVIGLKTAVEKGDFNAFKKEEGAIRLFNSGAFAMNRPLQKEVQKTYAEVAKAVEAKDAASLKSAWATYFKTAGLDKTNPFTKSDVGQAYSTDFTYTHNNPNFDPRK